MNLPALNDTERAVLDLLETRGNADQHEILEALDPELGMYYASEVLETLYRMKLIQEVDIGCFALRAVPEFA